ncbi:uncharacterized protein LOC135462799 isoform X1 [Liolophura sinensis]|uniref:uncharacterized protein LOC135462799 isoform X1 n=1 Tax=Liolophura sinensis TaxID=3198878 RepID=UPI0031593281
MAKNLMCAFFLIALTYSLCHSASISEEKIEAKTDVRSKRTADKISDLKTKLAQLQKLLDDIDKDKSTKASTPTPEATTPAPHSEKIDTEKGENTLSQADLLLLKSLKTAMENMHDEGKVHKKETVDLGHFYEAPLGDPENQADDKRTVHDKFYPQDPSQSFRLPQDGIPAKRTNIKPFMDTKNGHFEEFSEDRSEFLEKVVYRLLSDLDLALRNGISVEDIIKYLYETEEAARKKQQGNRIEEEERQLRALLNKEPAPRD